MDELKACPFCGSSNTTLDYYEISCPQELGTIVVCNDCGASAKSIVDWNTRPIEDALNARIAELEAAQHWIPVSEGLPDNWKSVLTIDMSKSTRDMVTAFYNPETSLWSTHFSCDLWVTHWMPLPEPPIVYGKVCEE